MLSTKLVHENRALKIFEIEHFNYNEMNKNLEAIVRQISLRKRQRSLYCIDQS